MKTILFTICFLFVGISLAQQKEKGEQNFKVSALTSIMLKQDYSVKEIADMHTNHPNKIKALDYYYAHSFQIQEGEKYTQEQLLKVNIAELDKLRLSEKETTVFDKKSKLHLVLDSFKTMKEKMQKIMAEKSETSSK